MKQVGRHARPVLGVLLRRHAGVRRCGQRDRQGDGVNGLTRTNLITAIKGLTDFDAGGMIGKRSFKDGKTTSCFMMVQFKSGKWVRQYPTKKGTFDCKASNAIEIKANLIQQ